jgi:hypothetical protein
VVIFKKKNLKFSKSKSVILQKKLKEIDFFFGFGFKFFLANNHSVGSLGPIDTNTMLLNITRPNKLSRKLSS